MYGILTRARRESIFTHYRDIIHCSIRGSRDNRLVCKENTPQRLLTSCSLKCCTFHLLNSTCRNHESIYADTTLTCPNFLNSEEQCSYSNVLERNLSLSLFFSFFLSSFFSLFFFNCDIYYTMYSLFIFFVQHDLLRTSMWSFHSTVQTSCITASTRFITVRTRLSFS